MPAPPPTDLARVAEASGAGRRRPWLAAIGAIGAIGAALALALGGCGSPSEDARELMTSVVADLNDFWTTADSELGFTYRPVARDRVQTADDDPVCDGRPVDREEIDGNAFVDAGCREGILVAYDPGYVEASLARAEATMAHEWGHVVQAQAREVDLSEDPEGLPIDAELQADCFAGAWSAELAQAEVPALRRDVARSGDPDGVEVDDPHAHGTPAEREVAFDVGFDGGPRACVEELIDALPD